MATQLSPLTSHATAEFVYQVEMDIATEVMFSDPQTSYSAASYAHSVAITMGRPDLAYAANEVMCGLAGDLFAEGI